MIQRIAKLAKIIKILYPLHNTRNYRNLFSNHRSVIDDVCYVVGLYIAGEKMAGGFRRSDRCSIPAII